MPTCVKHSVVCNAVPYHVTGPPFLFLEDKTPCSDHAFARNSHVGATKCSREVGLAHPIVFGTWQQQVNYLCGGVLHVLEIPDQVPGDNSCFWKPHTPASFKTFGDGNRGSLVLTRPSSTKTDLVAWAQPSRPTPLSKKGSHKTYPYLSSS